MTIEERRAGPHSAPPFTVGHLDDPRAIVRNECGLLAFQFETAARGRLAATCGIHGRSGTAAEITPDGNLVVECRIRKGDKIESRCRKILPFAASLLGWPLKDRAAVTADPVAITESNTVIAWLLAQGIAIPKLAGFKPGPVVSFGAVLRTPQGRYAYPHDLGIRATPGQVERFRSERGICDSANRPEPESESQEPAPILFNAPPRRHRP